MNIRCELPLAEVDGTEPTNPLDAMVVESHLEDDELVVLTIGGVSHAVLIEELWRAVKAIRGESTSLEQQRSKE